MVYCETCGQENTSSAKFCRSCGAAVGKSGYKQTVSPNRSESIGFGNRGTSEHLVISCSLCGGEDFARDTGRLDSKWGFTSFKVVMCTCKRCGHIELFNKGRSIFDFD
ncbi:MAG: zinc-ribbon domain-containing protein [Candidatus Hodarchaeales archaeon]|jgi:hypothetical protein